MSTRKWLPLLCLWVCGCAGSGSEIKPEVWRARLRSAMDESVDSRERRDQLSRVMIDATGSGALDRLMRPDVQAAFGPGLSCDGYELCAKQGFQGSDWYYPIGHATTDKIKQLPVLIIGFDTHDRVSRVYTLRTD
jgi:hypothetical protein